MEWTYLYDDFFHPKVIENTLFTECESSCMEDQLFVYTDLAAQTGFWVSMEFGIYGGVLEPIHQAYWKINLLFNFL